VIIAGDGYLKRLGPKRPFKTMKEMILPIILVGDLKKFRIGVLREAMSTLPVNAEAQALFDDAGPTSSSTPTR
jgi:hypothetical protein